MKHPAFTSAWKAWDVISALPSGCSLCAADIKVIYEHDSSAHPASRIAFLQDEKDELVSAGFFMMPASPVLTGNLKTLTHDTLEPLPNTRYFVPDSTIHTMSDNLAKSVAMDSQDGPATSTLGDWLTQMVTDDRNGRTGSPRKGSVFHP